MIRLAAIVCIGIFLIPLDEERKALAPEPVSLTEAAGAANEVYYDVQGFCLRNPSTCNAASDLAVLFKKKAARGLELTQSWLNGQPVGRVPNYPGPGQLDGALDRENIASIAREVPQKKPAQ